MSDVTQILARIESGDPNAADKLLPLVYEELRKLASSRLQHERSDHTIQSTALVHEAYLRLVDVDQVQHWQSRGHFFAAAAEAMRRILINHARDRHRLKRGGNRRKIDLTALDLAAPIPDEALLDLNEALDTLANEEPESATLVKLRFFAGMTLEEAAAAMGISRRTADRYWAYARAWLFEALQSDDDLVS